MASEKLSALDAIDAIADADLNYISDESEAVQADRGKKATWLQAFTYLSGKIISSQAGAPTSTPTIVGEINIDTTANRMYISTGTASSADWDIIVTPVSTDVLSNKTLTAPEIAAVSLPRLTFNQTGAAADEKLWRMGMLGGNFLFLTRTDIDGAGATPMTLIRSGTVVDELDIAVTLLDINADVEISGTSKFDDEITFTSTLIAGVNLNSLTTTERDALTPLAGMTIWNETTTQIEVYDGAAWVATSTGGGDSWDTPIDANITFDADNTYAIGAVGTGAADIYSQDFHVGGRVIRESDTDTFIEMASTNTISMTVGGVKAFNANAGAFTFNINGAPGHDFRVEGDTDQFLLSLDASTDQIAFGTQFPSDFFDVAGTMTVDGALTVGSTVDGVDIAARDLVLGTALQQGTKEIYIPASRIRPAVTAGCAALVNFETTALRPDIISVDFDQTTKEFGQFSVAFPKSWNLGVITYQVLWSTVDTNSTTVAWGLSGVAVADNGTIDAAYGTEITVLDANQGAGEDQLVSAVSAALTIAGTPADDELSYFQISRDPANGSDDLAADAKLIGIKLRITIDANNDD